MSDMHRRYLILAPGVFTTRTAKTAHGVIAYSQDTTVAILDPQHAGKRVREVLPYLHNNAPIVGDLPEGLAYKPTSLLIGVAPPGGILPPDWRSTILAAIDAKLEIVNGLHEELSLDPTFAAAAARNGVHIWDVRTPPPTPLFSGAAWHTTPHVVLTVGSDCSSGKMTASLELTRAARERGKEARFVATGQTGIMIAGKGIAIDRVISDFAAGAAERLILENAPGADLLFIEGQGGINHPAYAPVTLALLYGSAPDALVLVHIATRTEIDGYHTPILSYRHLIRMYESLCATMKPAQVIGIALNTADLPEGAARQAITRAHEETGLPADDVVRFGPHALYDAIAPNIKKTHPLRTYAANITG
jgi:uncharacterized NAD-dependent epimerase/dehydratase family protein